MIDAAKRLVQRVAVGLWDPGLKASVAKAAREHLSGFDYTGPTAEYGGTQYTISLHHCQISFWHYKMDVGSAIRPLSADPGVRYCSKQVAEEMVAGRSVRAEVDRQMQLILESYRPVLEGQFADWPMEDTQTKK